MAIHHLYKGERTVVRPEPSAASPSPVPGFKKEGERGWDEQRARGRGPHQDEQVGGRPGQPGGHGLHTFSVPQSAVGNMEQ